MPVRNNPIHTRDNLPSAQEVFGNALSIIRYFFCLELTLIEQVKLRTYSTQALNGLAGVGFFSAFSYQPHEEAVARFFCNEYEIPCDTHLRDIISGVVDESLTIYIRMLQEAMHSP